MATAVQVGNMLDSPTVGAPRQRGPSLARRTYQAGSVFQKGRSKAERWNGKMPAYGRYWKDAPSTLKNSASTPRNASSNRLPQSHSNYRARFGCARAQTENEILSSKRRSTIAGTRSTSGSTPSL